MLKLISDILKAIDYDLYKEWERGEYDATELEEVLTKKLDDVAIQFFIQGQKN